jgi:hypothetical protein
VGVSALALGWGSRQRALSVSAGSVCGYGGGENLTADCLRSVVKEQFSNPLHASRCHSRAVHGGVEGCAMLVAMAMWFVVTFPGFWMVFLQVMYCAGPLRD